MIDDARHRRLTHDVAAYEQAQALVDNLVGRRRSLLYVVAAFAFTAKRAAKHGTSPRGWFRVKGARMRRRRTFQYQWK